MKGGQVDFEGSSFLGARVIVWNLLIRWSAVDISISHVEPASREGTSGDGEEAAGW